MEGSSANRKPVSDGGIMEQADVPEEGDSLVGGWGRRALSSARTSPARRLINACKLACTFHMEKLIQKTASHSMKRFVKCLFELLTQHRLFFPR